MHGENMKFFVMGKVHNIQLKRNLDIKQKKASHDQ
jgi:hypothetical protein